MSKRFVAVVAFAVALVIALVATDYAAATNARTWNWQTDYYSWGSPFGHGSGTPLLSQIGDNPLFPGVHANYTANTAKCGVCHSVHRAVAGGVSLLPSSNRTCAGCHTGGATPVTALNVTWGAGPGPHGSANAATCALRACHLTNPHGVGGSQYVIVAQMLLNPATDLVLAAAVASPVASGITLAQLNATEPTATAWPESTRSAVRTGYNCNIAGCHVQTLLTVLNVGWAEQRKASYRMGLDFTGPAGIPAYVGPGPEGVSAATGQDPFKTGHRTVAVASYAGSSSFSPVTGCVSCHDQTDSLSTSGFTFPHGQTPMTSSVNNTAGTRAWLWMTMAENTIGTDYQWMDDPTDKAMDGACLKCHRSATSGIGLTR